MNIIERIQWMEQLYDRAVETGSVPPELLDYYESGQWLRDYEADERGELPPDLKRGVLSQDGLWNLLVREHPNASPGGKLSPVGSSEPTGD